MKNSYLFTVLVVVAGVLIFAKCNHADNIGDQMKLMQMKEFRRSLDKPINYYGKVVDLQRNPIPNVNVEVHISKASGKKIISYSTNAEGRFDVTGIDGSDLAVEKVMAQGYEYQAENRVGSHDLYENDGSIVIDKNNPVVFTMRKKEPPTVVVRGDISVTFDKNVKYYEVDLIEMIDEKPYGLNRYHGSYAHADLKTRFEHSTVDDSYVFILETPDSDSGIIAQDQMLYIPPETGYKTPYRITVPTRQKTTTYLYIKTRRGQVYSRLNIEFFTENGKVYWAAKVATNPLGERNLDYDETKFSEYLNQKIVNRKKMGQ